MAWVTYDLIEHYRENSAGGLRRQPVLDYLESLGFKVDHDGGSHCLVRAPDGDLITFGIHTGGKLTWLEVDTTYKKLTAYFEREAAREEQKLKDSVKGEEAFPEWLMTDGYLSKLGVRMKPEGAVNGNGMHSLVLIDREFPEFSVRVSYDYNGKALTQSAIEGSVKKLKDIKAGYIEAFSAVLKPYEDMVYAKRVKSGGVLMCELHDVRTDDFIASVPIPNMNEQDPTKRDALMNGMIAHISKILDTAYTGLALSQMEQAEIQQRRAKDLSQRAQRREDTLQRRHSSYEDLLQRLDVLGYDVRQETRDGVHGLVCTQREDYLRPLRELRDILEAKGNVGPLYKKYLDITRSMTGVDIQSMVKENTIVPYKSIDTGEFFLPLPLGLSGVPTQAGLAKIEAFVKQQEDDLNFDDMSSVQFIEENGKTYFSLHGAGKFPLKHGGAGVARGREMAIHVCELMGSAVQFLKLKDELAADGVIAQYLGAQRAEMRYKTYAVEVAPEGVDISVPSRAMLAAMHEGVRELSMNLVKDSLSRCQYQIVSEDERGITFISPDAKHTPKRLDYYVSDGPPFKAITQQLELMEKLSPMKRVLGDKIDLLQQYGFFYENGERTFWSPPDGLKKLKTLSAETPQTDRALDARLRVAEDIIAACDQRYQQQQTLLERVTAVDASAGLESLQLRYAASSDAAVLPAKALLDDESMSKLKKYVQALPEAAKPHVQVNTGVASITGTLDSPQLQK